VDGDGDGGEHWWVILAKRVAKTRQEKKRQEKKR
jgi:hypothetical protein